MVRPGYGLFLNGNEDMFRISSLLLLCLMFFIIMLTQGGNNHVQYA